MARDARLRTWPARHLRVSTTYFFPSPYRALHFPWQTLLFLLFLPLLFALLSFCKQKLRVYTREKKGEKTKMKSFKNDLLALLYFPPAFASHCTIYTRFLETIIVAESNDSASPKLKIAFFFSVLRIRFIVRSRKLFQLEVRSKK